MSDGRVESLAERIFLACLKEGYHPDNTEPVMRGSWDMARRFYEAAGTQEAPGVTFTPPQGPRPSPPSGDCICYRAKTPGMISAHRRACPDYTEADADWCAAQWVEPLKKEAQRMREGAAALQEVQEAFARVARPAGDAEASAAHLGEVMRRLGKGEATLPSPVVVDRWVSITAAAQRAYEAYGAHVSWLSVNRQPMPTWEHLEPRIRNAWEEATRGAFGLEPLRTPGSGAPPPATTIVSPEISRVLQQDPRFVFHKAADFAAGPSSEVKQVLERTDEGFEVVGEELRHDPTAG